MANPNSAAAREAMSAGLLGCIVTPGQRQSVPPGASWCADNGCFGKGYPGDGPWLEWLARPPGPISTCLFAVAPDVVGDAAATLARSAPWLPRIRALGYPAALAAQNGLELLDVPWDTFDVLFLGGSTDWKLGPAAAHLAAEAALRGKPVHMGRVNSLRRLRAAMAMGCSTCDGTHLTFGPTKNLAQLLRWLPLVHQEKEAAGAH